MTRTVLTINTELNWNRKCRNRRRRGFTTDQLIESVSREVALNVELLARTFA